MVSQRDGMSMDAHFQGCSPPERASLSSTADPSRESSGDQVSVLASRAPQVLARLTRIENVHVRSDERPSNLAKPLSIPSQASWTTSSADCGLSTNDRARRNMAGDHWSTNC